MLVLHFLEAAGWLMTPVSVDYSRTEYQTYLRKKRETIPLQFPPSWVPKTMTPSDRSPTGPFKGAVTPGGVCLFSLEK